MRQIHIVMKSMGLLMLGASFVGFTGSEKFITLNQYMNARASATFTQDRSNVKFVIPPGTQAEILSHRKFFSGNFGLRVRLTTGSHAGEEVWVYYNVENPTMTLSHRDPQAATEAKTTAPTPASETPPREVASTAATTAATAADSCTNRACTSASVSAELAQTKTFVQDFVERTSRNAAIGARRVMANMYQSCSVLRLEPYNPKASGHGDLRNAVRLRTLAGGLKRRSLPAEKLNLALESHYYIQNQTVNNPQCMDMRQTPPVFQPDSRPSFSEDGQTINIFTRPETEGHPTVGIDCSSFVSVALSVAGLKIQPNIQTARSNTALTTSRKLFQMNEGNSCFVADQIARDGSLHSGDIMAWPGHTLLIDQVGTDPFGLDQLRRNGDLTSAQSCDRPSLEVLNNLNFTIIQSGAMGDLPAARIKASDYVRNSSAPVKEHFLNMWKKACYAQLDPNFSETFSNLSGFRMLRHKGDKDPRCLFPPENTPKMANENECTQGCKEEVNT